MATPARPLVLPDTFCGSGESNWTEWKFHFDNVAAVNGWGAEDQLKWLKVRLTGRAQTAFQHLSVENQATFALATAALKERFEPATRKHRYQAELQVRKKRKGESWADFAEDLKSIADKAYPDLEEKARERLALNSYLAQLDHPQVAFGVKQTNPANLDAAVSATLELESYAMPKGSTLPVLGVAPEDCHEDEDTTVGAVDMNTTGKLTDLIKGISERLERLEGLGRRQGPSQHDPSGSGNSNQYNRRDRYPRRRDPTCYNCGMSGHIARYCRQYPQPGYPQPYYSEPPRSPLQQPQQPQQPLPQQPQGNRRPSV